MSGPAESAVSREPARFVVVDPGTPGEVVWPLESRLFIGRECEGANCILLGDDLAISRNHLEIRLDPAHHHAVAIDSSKYGTRVNGRRVEPGLSVPLSNGDRIQVGRHAIEFRVAALVTTPRTNGPSPAIAPRAENGTSIPAGAPNAALPPTLRPQAASRRAPTRRRRGLVGSAVVLVALGGGLLAARALQSAGTEASVSRIDTAPNPAPDPTPSPLVQTSFAPDPLSVTQTSTVTRTSTVTGSGTVTHTGTIYVGPTPAQGPAAPPTPAAPVTYGLPPKSEPPESPSTPTPDFRTVCYTNGQDSASCVAAGVQAIDTARKLEGLGPIHLPTDYANLGHDDQLFVLADLERVDRGLPPFVGLVDALNQAAAAGANAMDDPSPGALPPQMGVLAWRSNWAYEASPLHADYFWMYADGPGGGNIDCQPGHMTGCWVHRDNILWNLDPSQLQGTTLVMGTAQTWPPSLAPNVSMTQLLALATGTPSYTYSWAQAVANGAG